MSFCFSDLAKFPAFSIFSRSKFCQGLVRGGGGALCPRPLIGYASALIPPVSSSSFYLLSPLLFYPIPSSISSCVLLSLYHASLTPSLIFLHCFTPSLYLIQSFTISSRLTSLYTRLIISLICILPSSFTSTLSILRLFTPQSSSPDYFSSVSYLLLLFYPYPSFLWILLLSFTPYPPQYLPTFQLPLLYYIIPSPHCILFSSLTPHPPLTLLIHPSTAIRNYV